MAKPQSIENIIETDAHSIGMFRFLANHDISLKNTIYQYDGQMDIFNQQPATTMIDSDLF